MFEKPRADHKLVLNGRTVFWEIARMRVEAGVMRLGPAECGGSVADDDGLWKVWTLTESKPPAKGAQQPGQPAGERHSQDDKKNLHHQDSVIR